MNSISPAAHIAQILEDLDIAQHHGEASLSEASAWLQNPGLDDPSLTDWTSLPFVTIDNPDSRDLDQALLIERHDAGYRVRYALADASYYIRPGSELFAQALAKGTTYYTPIMAASLLPETLSEGLISLNPDVDRRALVFDMIVDETVSVCNTSVTRARMRSQAKLSYAGVQAWLNTGSAPVQAYEYSLKLLEELGNKLIEAAALRGVINFDRTETQILVSDTPPRFTATRRQRYETERYNEQISLMCNMQGAEMLLALSGASDAMQAVYRVHEAPLRKSLGELKILIMNFARQQEQPAMWQWKDGQSLADYVHELPSQPEYQRRVRTLQRQIMQAQRASTFQVDAGEHHALKAASYARFSSPMREVVGIFTHKELIEALHGEFSDNSADLQLREAVIDSANAARQRQRQLDKRIEFAALHDVFSVELESEQKPRHNGTLIGMRRDKFYISLDDMAIDVKLYRENLESQYSTDYTISDIAAEPADPEQPRWRLGQAVQLSISAFDRERKHFLFTITAPDHDSN